MHIISEKLKAHYRETFKNNGPNAKGVDWGAEDEVNLRYDRMIRVIDHTNSAASSDHSVLDVGCGYGGLRTYMNQNDLQVKYTGIDVVEEMIDCAKGLHKDCEFITGDILDIEDEECYDFVVCNGILTQKLDAGIKQTDEFAQVLIKKMFGLSKKGIAVNTMKTKVNFMAPNLYYRNPVELLAWCMNEVTDRVILDHAYPLYEYTIYLYKDSV